MSQALRLVARNPPGCGGIYDKCLLGDHGKSALAVSSCSLNGKHRILSPYNIGSLKVKCVNGRTSSVCKASSSGHRRNSDFSRRGHGFGGRWQSEERGSYENLDESEILSLKHRPFRPLSNSTEFQATAAPGSREKEIMELFRKVQAHLRERAAVNELSQQKGKESEKVDSLLKILRNHSVNQGKQNSSSGSHMDLNVGRSNVHGYYFGGKIASATSNGAAGKEVRGSWPTNSNRSVYRRNSPASQDQHIFTGKKTAKFDNTTNTVFPLSRSAFEPEDAPGSEHEFGEEQDSDSEAYMHPKSHYQETDVFNNLAEEDEFSDIDADNDGEEEQLGFGQEDLSAMNLTQLRTVAKSRGVKGFSKMKRVELLELLGCGLT